MELKNIDSLVIAMTASRIPNIWKLHKKKNQNHIFIYICFLQIITIWKILFILLSVVIQINNLHHRLPLSKDGFQTALLVTFSPNHPTIIYKSISGHCF